MTFPRSPRPSNPRGVPTFRRTLNMGFRGRFVPTLRVVQNGFLRGEISFYVEQLLPPPATPPRPPRVTRPFPQPPPQEPQVTRRFNLSVSQPPSAAASVQFAGEEFGRPWFLVSPPAGPEDSGTCQLCQALNQVRAPTATAGGPPAGDTTPPQPPPVRLFTRGRLSFRPQRRRQGQRAHVSDSGSASSFTDSSRYQTPSQPGSAGSSGSSQERQTSVQQRREGKTEERSTGGPSAHASHQPDREPNNNWEAPQSQDGGAQIKADVIASKVKNDATPEKVPLQQEFQDELKRAGSEREVVENVRVSSEPDQLAGTKFPEKFEADLITPILSIFQIPAQVVDVRPSLPDGETGARSIGEHSYHIRFLRPERGEGCDAEVQEPGVVNPRGTTNEPDSTSHVDGLEGNESGFLPGDGVQLPGYARPDEVDGHKSVDDGEEVGMKQETLDIEDSLVAQDPRSADSENHKDSPFPSDPDRGHRDESHQEDVLCPHHALALGVPFQNGDTLLQDGDDEVYSEVYSEEQSEDENEKNLPADMLKDAAYGTDPQNIQLPESVYRAYLSHCKRTKMENGHGLVDYEVGDGSTGPADLVDGEGNPEDQSDGDAEGHDVVETAGVENTTDVVMDPGDDKEVGVCACAHVFKPQCEECVEMEQQNVPDDVKLPAGCSERSLPIIYYEVEEQSVRDDDDDLPSGCGRSLPIISDGSAENTPEKGECGDRECPPTNDVGKEDCDADSKNDKLPTSVYRRRLFESNETEDDVIAVENQACHSKQNSEAGDYSDDDIEILSVQPITRNKDSPRLIFHLVTESEGQLSGADGGSTVEIKDGDVVKDDDCKVDEEELSGESTRQGQDGEDDRRAPSVEEKKESGGDTRLPRAAKRTLRSLYRSERGQSSEERSVSSTEDDKVERDTPGSRRAGLRSFRRQTGSKETPKRARKN